MSIETTEIAARRDLLGEITRAARAAEEVEYKRAGGLLDGRRCDARDVIVPEDLEDPQLSKIVWNFAKAHTGRHHRRARGTT